MERAAGRRAGECDREGRVRCAPRRTRQNKLTHLIGPGSIVGTEVTVRIDHAGAYALRGSLLT